ncbi:MAG TPA: TAT-variant-translocated molybdopterin oxidoreductase [Bacteroidia bacterium]|nr:TAT-variant-translocated molybdopterin oxidoreductase [Bacteroidia bacterium]
MGTKNKYWKGLPELHQSPEFLQKSRNEFAENLPMEEVLGSESLNASNTSRRDFLKVMGFTTAAVALASCETPVINAIPYVNKPEEVTPGVANFYASTFYDGHDYASVLVKTREGRPIKIEANELSKHNHGTNARTQAAVLSLYDGARLSSPWAKGAPTTWKNADSEIGKALANAGGKEIAILSSTIISPSARAVIAEFVAKYPTTKLYQYDAVSYSALSNANEKVWGKKVVSKYHFHEAKKVVVGVACDFLGNWLSPVEFASGYSHNRKVSKENPNMSKHYHFEANMSLTGANADERFMIKPSEIGKTVAALYNEVAKATGNASVSANGTIASNSNAQKAISKIAKELAEAKGQSLVLCGLNDTDTQVLVNGINKMLDNYGKTVDIENYCNLKQGDDKQFMDLIADMNSGKVGVVMAYNCNPVYTAPVKAGFAAAYKKVPVKISFAQSLDETAQASDYVCPDHNWLESWGDANPCRGHYSLQQPAINPIFAQPRYEGTRQVQDTLLAWAGVKTDYLTYLQAFWQNRVFPMQGKYGDFYSFWSNTLHDGILHIHFAKPVEEVIAPMAKDSSGKPLMTGIATVIADSLGIAKEKIEEKKEEKILAAEEKKIEVDYNAAASKAVSAKGGNWEITVYEKVGLGNGNMSNNPWLHELPDPISKVTWDNYITMHPEDVKAQGFGEMLRQDIEGSMATLTVNGVTVELPVYPQPGQAKGTIGVALGYGRKAETMQVATLVAGANAYDFCTISNDTVQNISAEVSVANANKSYTFAATQIQHTIMGREEWILRETSLGQYKKDAASNNPKTELATHSGKLPINEVDLWAAHDRPGHKWGLTIDMNSCIGCAACVVACSSENNVPVVGKDQIMRTRDMYWLRIDRYYTSDMTRMKAEEEHTGSRQMYLGMENPSHNPKVTFQPIMCQHCNHAPCETVCPVLATNHSNEGLNQMTYNRCIGTRYCANNCPFKVRRFNWYNYNGNPTYATINPIQQDLGRMVLNPDVVVRGRGVMEKCSMCAQRLQAGKLSAKKEGKPLQDGAIKTACQQSCPTNAIIFGDLSDTESKVAKLREDERNYFLLEEIGIKPTVSYLVKVRNQEEEIVWEAEEAAETKAEEKKEEKKEEAHS